jgi:hypothetical protein
MEQGLSRRKVMLLAAGDLIVLIVVTLVGFASHGTLETAGGRLWVTFFSMLVAWAVAAPALGVYNLELSAQPIQLWRSFLAAVLAAPLAGVIRGLWLGLSVSPIFIIVLGGISALSLLAWRGLYLVFHRMIK